MACQTDSHMLLGSAGRAGSASTVYARECWADDEASDEPAWLVMPQRPQGVHNACRVASSVRAECDG